MNLKMNKLCLITTVTIIAISGCSAGKFVRPQVATEKQIVIRHATAEQWYKEAWAVAAKHCEKYGKSAVQTNNDCGSLTNSIHGAKECMTTWNCE